MGDMAMGARRGVLGPDVGDQGMSAACARGVLDAAARADMEEYEADSDGKVACSRMLLTPSLVPACPLDASLSRGLTILSVISVLCVLISTSLRAVAAF